MAEKMNRFIGSHSLPHPQQLGNRKGVRFRVQFLIAAPAVSRFHRDVSKSKRFFLYWLPVLLWMMVIFSASADSHSYQHSSRLLEPLLHWLFPRMSQATVEQIHFYFRKTCHLSEYGILALLLWRAIRQPQKGITKPWRWSQAGLVLLLVFLYAASDETHQIFVPTRTPHVTDVLIDTSGGAIVLLLLWSIGKIRGRSA